MAQIRLIAHKSHFNEIYLPVFKDTNPFIILYGGAASGKSHFVAQRLVMKLMKEKRRCLVVRKVYNTIRRSCFDQLKKVLEDWKILQFCKITEGMLGITLPNGSEFIFYGVDAGAEKLKSLADVADIWCEEATELDDESFDQLTLRLRGPAKNKQVFITFNPVSKNNWIYQKFFTNKMDDVTIIKSTYKDNRFIDKETVERIERLKTVNPTYYKIYALGEWGNLEKTIFTNWRVEPCQDKMNNLFVGLDFGWNDPSAICVVNVDQANKKIYVLDEVLKSEMFVEDIAQELRRMNVAHLPVFCDSADPRGIASLKRLGIKAVPAEKGRDSVAMGLLWLQQHEIIIDPKCVNMIEAMKNYSWMKDKDGNYISQPKHDIHSHLPDSLRYACSSLIFGGKRLKTLPKHVFGL